MAKTISDIRPVPAQEWSVKEWPGEETAAAKAAPPEERLADELTDLDDQLKAIMAYRRKETTFRLMMMVIILASTQYLWPLTVQLWWVGVYVALQVFELCALPYVDDRFRNVRITNAMTLTIIALNSFIFAAPAIIWCVYAGEFGMICGVYLLCGSMLNTVLNTRNCAPVFYASILPFALYAMLGVAAVALMAKGTSAHLVAFAPVTLAIFAAMTALTALRLWSRSSNTRRSEIAALIQLRQSKIQLELALRRAEAGSHAKTVFLAAMSHELRTPLNAIIGFSGILAQQVLGPLGDERYREYSEDISRSGANLLELINDILEYSLLDSDNAVLRENYEDIASLIEDVIRQIEPVAGAAGVHVRMEVGGGLAAMRIDSRRMQKALKNLLSNAVKFTPEGGEIVVSAFKSAQGQTICVSDTGAGIAEEHIPGALERFCQIDDSMGRKFEGVGLGLPLARRIVERHEGRLELKSIVGVGTQVFIHLPDTRVLSLGPKAMAAA